MEIKLNCECGQKYKFDVEPRDGRMPITVACPICGVDGTPAANQFLAEQFPAPSVPVPVPPPITVRIRRAEPETPALIGTAALTPEGAVFIPASGPVAPKSYYAKLPGAFAYPFKGS